MQIKPLQGRRVVITGLGVISSIGNDSASVVESLKLGRSGIELFEEFNSPDIPIKLAGTIKNFSFSSTYFEDWKLPAGYSLTREEMRSMTPNGVYGYCAMQQAIQDARLAPEEISNPRTSIMSAAGASMWMAYDNLHIMQTQGVQRCQPMAIVNSIPGALYINLGAIFKIQGGALGFSSACSSSAHALGNAYDQIAFGRQDRTFVVGAEDCNKFTFLPFTAVRALSPQTDPKKAPRAFDQKRDGFVPTGGAAVLVLEELETALKRGAKIYAELIGWGQTSDGFNVLAPDPTGQGLSRCMNLAMQNASIQSEEVDAINAHATSTPVGDTAELRAIKASFPNKKPWVSSTKSLTGHALSGAGALEALISCLSIHHGFIPLSANISELDPEAEGIPIPRETLSTKPRLVMSNSSGFGGTNVSLLFKALD